ncbi:50S ribosomal protein L4 [Infirmifilum lucidum]|uniref:Large ribosomal subunit protein uL4 n=1 Tax=Infirmifilum lucidum TaxID=2776706 RepID=A0A7L9FHB5_9CREN|nr:50S ribosomal protein L4 [Infirmifilum lucidum]QOJ78393.1 50S ribosomal protein L4 [Infirmifilum lucidum]
MSSTELVLREVPVYGLDGNEASKAQLPSFFYSPVRVDLIRRAFLAIFTSKLQPKGTDPLAGLRTTAESLGVGHGIARVARIKGGMRAARVPQAVKGRRVHPPKVEKKLKENINKKEKKLALASALAATAIRELVVRRGHVVPEKQLPIVVVDEIEKVNKASQLREIFKKLGVWGDVERAAERVRVRAGKGKMRGRKYKKPKSVLIVASNSRELSKAARNMPGVEVVSARNLTVSHLAPGGVPGRLTIYTLEALRILEERLKDVEVRY